MICYRERCNWRIVRKYHNNTSSFMICFNKQSKNRFIASCEYKITGIKTIYKKIGRFDILNYFIRFQCILNFFIVINVFFTFQTHSVVNLQHQVKNWSQLNVHRLICLLSYIPGIFFPLSFIVYFRSFFCFRTFLNCLRFPWLLLNCHSRLD